MGSEEVVVQSQLPFVVKEEPIDDGFNVCFEERIKIGPEASTSNAKPIQEATNLETYEKRICQLEKTCRDLFEQLNNLKEKLSHEVPINNQQALIKDLRDQLARKNATCSTHSVESDEKMQLISSKYETILRTFGQQKVAIDQHLNEIEELKIKLSAKDSLYVALETDKKSVENEVQQSAVRSNLYCSTQEFVKDQLDEMSTKQVEIVTVEKKADSQTSEGNIERNLPATFSQSEEQNVRSRRRASMEALAKLTPTANRSRLTSNVQHKRASVHWFSIINSIVSNSFYFNNKFIFSHSKYHCDCFIEIFG